MSPKLSQNIVYNRLVDTARCSHARNDSNSSTPAQPHAKGVLPKIFDGSKESSRHHVKGLLSSRSETIDSGCHTQSKVAMVHKAVSNTWIKEVLAWLVSAAFTIGMVATLQRDQGRAAPSFPYSVTLNAIVATLNTFARAWMLIPLVEALSQLKWLWFGRSRRLAQFEAFDEASRGPWGSLKLLRVLLKSPISALAALITVASLAVDPFAQQLVRYQSRLISVGNGIVPYAQTYYQDIGVDTDLEATLPMRAALYTGLYGTAQSIGPACPTASCTWPNTYSSLAVCSKCQDVTALLATTSGISHGHGEDSPSCNSSLPDGPYLYTRTEGLANNTIFNLTPLSVPNPWALANITLITRGSGYTNCNNVTAQKCELKLCVKTYAAKFEDGHSNETVIRTWIKTPDTESWDSQEYDWPPQGVVASGQNKTFGIDPMEMGALQDFFRETFQASGYYMGPHLVYSSDVARALHKADANKLMANVAASMTAEIRRAGNESANSIGSAWSSEIYVEVRWNWIALLVALEFLTLLVLIGTIFESRRKKTPIWKSSSLPVLRCRLIAEDAFAMDEATGLYEMNRVADESYVQLQRTDHAAKLASI